MSKFLNNLKLSNAVKPIAQDVDAVRRMKLANKLEEQTQLAQACSDGRTLNVTKLCKMKNKQTGDSEVREVPKRVNKWWFETETGSIAINIRYGTKLIELAKGKSAVEVADLDELVATLKVLKQAVLAGELDAQIKAASAQIRQRFE